MPKMNRQSPRLAAKGAADSSAKKELFQQAGTSVAGTERPLPRLTPIKASTIQRQSPRLAAKGAADYSAKKELFPQAGTSVAATERPLPRLTPIKTSRSRIQRQSPRLAAKQKADVATKEFLDATTIHQLVSSTLSAIPVRVLTVTDTTGIVWLEITREVADVTTTEGLPVYSTKLTINTSNDGDGMCDVSIFDQKWESAPVLVNGRLDEQALLDTVQLLQSPYVPCHGVPPTLYATLKYETKQIEPATPPTERYSSKRCSVIYKRQRKARPGEPQQWHEWCSNCKKAYSDVQRMQKKKDEGKDIRSARVHPSSHHPLKFMSPKSKTVRGRKAIARATHLRRKIKKMQKRLRTMKIAVDDLQNVDIAKAVSVINQNHHEELENIYREAEASAGKLVADSLRKTWDADSSRKEFLFDQAQNITGRKTNVWSMTTYRMALAIYVRSPAAYNAIKDLGVMQLPSESSLKDFTGAKLFAPGAAAWENHVLQEAERYWQIKNKIGEVSSGDPATARIPQQEGVLIFHEVRVIGKIMWNTKNHQMYGLAMSPDELSSLHGVYKTVDPKSRVQKAKYCLQFLWRDCTSDFDLIGPYYMSEGVQPPSHIMACLQDTMRLLHKHGFIVNSCL
ncbi:PREDICTED: uncharacterized protein LOC106821341 [Priapulus caudatus]|uniref:Uncharacterized protein LOC106821341 n=1 Tax=Priapulus caudatus TaxID=37621 RepID=A0ABM1FAW2_PRICU|nr:PREDICTED: uncharacterized protein LOC106821341 [Priapulus caudatus]